MACEALPDVDAALRSSKTDEKRWPEASCASYMWIGVEDMIVQAMANCVSAKPYAHLSLHFDGGRVDKACCQAESGADGTPLPICKALEAHILDEIGYKVEVVAFRSTI